MAVTAEESSEEKHYHLRRIRKRLGEIAEEDILSRLAPILSREEVSKMRKHIVSLRKAYFT